MGKDGRNRLMSANEARHEDEMIPNEETIGNEALREDATIVPHPGADLHPQLAQLGHFGQFMLISDMVKTAALLERDQDPLTVAPPDRNVPTRNRQENPQKKEAIKKIKTMDNLEIVPYH